MPLSACRHNSNIIRKYGEALTSLGYLVFLPRRLNFIVFEGIEIDLETSILSNGITAEYYCTMEKLSNRDLPEQHLILPAIPMLIALIWCRNVSFNYKKPQDEYRLGEKVLIFVNRSVTDSTWWQT